jgi:tetratricopeptide (TPR) repeat protein
VRSWPRLGAGFAALALAVAAGCADPGLNRGAGGVFAPGRAGGEGADPLETGHRLMAAGEFELARDAFLRAAARDGLSVDVLSGIGSADLRLGRLGQAERWLRQAVEKDATFVPAWNNLGVVLMEKGEYGEASEAFRRAYALDSGGSDTIRDNLRLALARLEDPFYTGVNETAEVQLIGWGTESRPLTEEPL